MFESLKNKTRRRHCLAIFDAAVAAVSPAKFVPASLPPPPETGKLVILSAGKAGGSMAAAAEAHYLDTLGFPGERMAGLVVTRHGYGAPLRVLRDFGAGLVERLPGVKTRLMAAASGQSGPAPRLFRGEAI